MFELDKFGWLSLHHFPYFDVSPRILIILEKKSRNLVVRELAGHRVGAGDVGAEAVVVRAHVEQDNVFFSGKKKIIFEYIFL